MSRHAVPIDEMYEVDPATGCWVWLGSFSHAGYGHRRYKGRLTTAHRAMFLELRGSIPDGLDLDHLCRNRACVNPDHLEPVSRRVNVLRGEGPAAIWAARTHCQAGHPFSGDNLYVRPGGARQCRECKRLQQRKAA